eukprot:scaffold42272_cov25-Prasinocladus_malaysianus.AAC.3
MMKSSRYGWRIIRLVIGMFTGTDDDAAPRSPAPPIINPDEKGGNYKAAGRLPPAGSGQDERRHRECIEKVYARSALLLMRIANKTTVVVVVVVVGISYI